MAKEQSDFEIFFFIFIFISIKLSNELKQKQNENNIEQKTAINQNLKIVKQTKIETIFYSFSHF